MDNRILKPFLVQLKLIFPLIVQSNLPPTSVKDFCLFLYPIPYLLINSTNNLPLRQFTLHQLMRLTHIPPRKHPLNRHFKTPIHKPPQLIRTLHQQIPQPPLILQPPTPQPTPLPSQPLPLQQPNIQSLNLRPTQTRQLHNPPIHRRNFKVPLRVIPPYEIHNHINAIPVRRVQDPFHPVIGMVIKPLRRAQLLAERNLCV